MKKMLALILALLSLFSFSFADEAVVEPMYFVPEAAEAYPGEFVALEEIGLMMYLPENFQSMGPVDGTAVYYVFGSDDGIGISVTVATMAELEIPAEVTTLEALCEFCNGEGGMPGAYINAINDLPCILWESAEQDAAVVTYMTDTGYVFMFAYTPITNPDIAPQLGVIMTSVMPIPAE